MKTMQYVHPHKVNKKLGVIHEDQPTLHPLSLVGAAVPPRRPSQYLLDPNGPFFSLSALMQGFSSQCGGFTLAQLINFLGIFVKGFHGVQLSGSFDYAYEKTVDGYPNDDGTTVSAIGKAGNLAGACLETLFPDDGNVASNPDGKINTPYSNASPAAIADALTRTLGLPFLLDDLSIDGVHQACFENGAVILEVKLGKEWYTDRNGNETWDAAEILPLRPPADPIDDHFILVGPYDEPNDRTWFINTWSKQWGQNGFAYFNSNYAPYIKNGIAFKKLAPSIAHVVQNPAIPLETKRTIIQMILDDIAAAIALIQKEI